MGCTQQSSVHIDRLGVQYPITYVDYAKIDGAEIYWAVGDNSDAFRPALYAPHPGPYTYWCLGIYSSKTNPKAVYVERVSGEDRYRIYELRDVKSASSDQVIKGDGNAHIRLTDRQGKILEQPPSSVFPTETRLEFTLHRPIKEYDRKLKVILDDLRPVAEPFLTENLK